MSELGFEAYLLAEHQSYYIITTYCYPSDPGFSFERFYQELSELGCIIYPGKLSKGACFRIGTIGRLEMSDVEKLTSAIRTVMSERAKASSAS
jgi:2-aminoethylphosphonate-pyruvate transaminase